jgi:hypothetical protein
MKTIRTTILFILIYGVSFNTFSQHLGLTFDEAKEQGIVIAELDSTYQSASHSDTSLAVFKTEEEREAWSNEYINFLKSFGKFLSENDFLWDNPTRCFNRIYFNSDGAIDYFLFRFIEENSISEEREKEFHRLLNLFIQDYKLSITASVKYVQCGPVTYRPKEK